MPIIFCVLSCQVRHFCPGKALYQAQRHIHACGNTTSSDDAAILNPPCLGNPRDMGALGDNPSEGLFIAGSTFSVQQLRRRQQTGTYTNGCQKFQIGINAAQKRQQCRIAHLLACTLTTWHQQHIKVRAVAKANRRDAGRTTNAVYGSGLLSNHDDFNRAALLQQRKHFKGSKNIQQLETRK